MMKVFSPISLKDAPEEIQEEVVIKLANETLEEVCLDYLQTLSELKQNVMELGIEEEFFEKRIEELKVYYTKVSNFLNSVKTLPRDQQDLRTYQFANSLIGTDEKIAKILHDRESGHVEVRGIHR